MVLVCGERSWNFYWERQIIFKVLINLFGNSPASFAWLEYSERSFWSGFYGRHDPSPVPVLFIPGKVAAAVPKEIRRVLGCDGHINNPWIFKAHYLLYSLYTTRSRITLAPLLGSSSGAHLHNSMQTTAEKVVCGHEDSLFGKFNLIYLQIRRRI